MQKITPFLWFKGNAEEAVNFYVSVFRNAKLVSMTRYGDAGPGPKGSVMTAAFQIDGQEFIALNGGPEFTFTPAISFVVNCADQAEVDYYWDKLSAGGQTQQCGWLTDKFGLCWQIVPTVLPRLLKHTDSDISKRVMNAMLRMTKIEIAPLEQAAEQASLS